MEKIFDVIIAGAGPAGLSLASVLSQNHKVCVFDKNKIGSTTKSWASFRDLIEKLDLGDSIINNRIEALEFGHYLGAKWVFKDIYCQLNEPKLLEIFTSRCKKENITFISSFEINTFQKIENGVEICKGNDKFRAKLLIDCMGADSPIVKKFDLISNRCPRFCCGAYFVFIKNANFMVLA